MREVHEEVISMLEIDFKRVGDRVRKARKERQITQEELCERCGCTTSHLSRLETGRGTVSLTLLFRIGVELEYPMDYFIMDCSFAFHEVKVNYIIRKKLLKCSANSLDLIEKMLDTLLEHEGKNGGK